MWQHLSELEQAEPAIEAAAAKLIDHARRHDPQIGKIVHIDSTEPETHVRLLHDCPPEDHCPHQTPDVPPG